MFWHNFLTNNRKMDIQLSLLALERLDRLSRSEKERLETLSRSIPRSEAILQFLTMSEKERLDRLDISEEERLEIMSRSIPFDDAIQQIFQKRISKRFGHRIDSSKKCPVYDDDGNALLLQKRLDEKCICGRGLIQLIDCFTPICVTCDCTLCEKRNEDCECCDSCREELRENCECIRCEGCSFSCECSISDNAQKDIRQREGEVGKKVSKKQRLNKKTGIREEGEKKVSKKQKKYQRNKDSVKRQE